MDDDLEHMTVKQLRKLARDEGICLGSDGNTKHNIVGAIRSQRRYRRLCAMETVTCGTTTVGQPVKGGEPWRTSRQA